MNYRVVALLLLVLSLLPAVGCDEATPVAPNGAVLTVSANPSKIGLNGTSTITVIGRKPDGNPLNPGTEVRVTADKGTLDSTLLAVDSHGEATTTFHGDGRSGDAKITAATGGGMTMATTTVQVGETDTTKPTVLVSVTPSTIALEGTAVVTVIARNADGSPVAAGERATVTTSLGQLTDEHPVIGANGTTTTTLKAGDRPGTATITAIVGASAAATTMATIVLDAATAISVTVNPASVAASSGGAITVTATVINAQAQSVVGAVVTFQSEFGRFEDNDAETTNDKGQASKTLNVSAGELSSTTDASFTVTAKTPSSSGSFLEGSTTVRITRQGTGGS